jgi:hypothetical protein
VADKQLVYIIGPPPLRNSPSSFLSLVFSIVAIYKADYSRILYVPSQLSLDPPRDITRPVGILTKSTLTRLVTRPFDSSRLANSPNTNEQVLS